MTIARTARAWVLSLIGLAASPMEASVSILSTNVLNPQDANGQAIANGSLGLVIVDTGNNGFGKLSAGTIASNQFVGDGDDLIISRLASKIIFGRVVFQLGGISISVSDGSPVHSGQSFALIWFPELTLAAEIAAKDLSYGMARQSNWVIPEDGNDILGDLVDNAGPANLVAGDAITNNSPYSLWRSTHFTATEQGDSSIGGNDADPDGDSLSNLMEYVLRGNPKAFQAKEVIDPILYAHEGQTYLAVVLPTLEDSGVVVEGQCSTDLVDWSPTKLPMSAPNGRRFILDNEPITSGKSRFLRLHARLITNLP